MSMQIESARYLQQFAKFAEANEDNGDAIARFSDNNPNSRKIVVTTGDHIRSFSNFWGDRTAENVAANNQVRQHFILNVLKCLGWDPAQSGIQEGQMLTQAQIEEAVNEILPGQENNARRDALLKDLKIEDYGQGRPLTSRRIGATLTRVKAVLEDRAALGGDDWSYASGGKVVLSENLRILSSLEPEKSGLHSDPVDPAFKDAIKDNMGNFLRCLLRLGHNAKIFNRNGISKEDGTQICEALMDDRDWLESMLKGNLKEIVGIVKNQCGPNVGEDALRRFLIDILKTYNRQQRIDELRVMITEEEIESDNLAPVKKNASDVKVDDPPSVRKIGRQIVNFMICLSDPDLQAILSRHYVAPEEDTENRDSRILTGAFWIKEAFLRSAFKWSQKMVDGDLDEVVRALRTDSMKDFDDDVLRRVVRDILKAYNENQTKEELRVELPQV